MPIHAFGPNQGSKAIHPGGTVGFNVLTTAHTNGSHALVIADAVVGAAPPYHRHTADETFLILEGTFELISEGVAFIVGPGGVAYIPGGTPHTIRCTHPGPRGVGKTAVILAPAGLEGFFDEVEQLRAAGHHPTPEALATLAAPYGIEFLGPEPHINERRSSTP
jgi:mannose-6-phosphate isomerase-like protein (cupin superfamily)